MKKFLAALAVLSATAANAMDAKFGDLNYFLQQGQMNLAADANIRSETTTVDGSKEIVDGYVFNADFGYALTNELNLTLGVQEVWDMKNDGANASGLQNPVFGANYRLFKQADAGYNLDLGAKLGLKITDREVPSTDKDGNMINPVLSNYAEPRNTLELNARAGNKWNEANEFYLLAGVIYHTSGEYKQLDGNDVDMDSSMDLKVGGYYQYRPVNEFMMTLGLLAKQFNEVDGENGSSDFTYEQHIDTEFSFVAKYLVNDSSIVKFQFSQDQRAEYNIENEGAADTKVDDRTAMTYGLGVDFLF